MLDADGGLAETSVLGEDQAEIGAGLRVMRSALKRLLIVAQRLLAALGDAQRVGQIVVKISRFGIHLDGGAEASLGLIHLTLDVMIDPQIVVGRGIARIDAQRFVKIKGGLDMSALEQIQQSQIVHGSGISRIEVHGLAEEVDGLIQSPQLIGDESGMIERLGKFRAQQHGA